MRRVQGAASPAIVPSSETRRARRSLPASASPAAIDRLAACADVPRETVRRALRGGPISRRDLDRVLRAASLLGLNSACEDEQT